MEQIEKMATNNYFENLVENSPGLSQYHSRVLRILKRKGYLTEEEIKNYSLLPIRDARAVINQLL